ncbi:MAG: hypothetical protein RLZZ352_2595 [Pseudomonadota bacterium]|jgi:hypothetical protein
MRHRHTLQLRQTRADRPGRVLVAWVLVAWVLATLAPGLSRCLQHLENGAGLAAPRTALAHWVELCGPQGMHWVRLDSLKDPPPTQPADPGEGLNACAHCVLAVDRLASLVPLVFQWQALPAKYGPPGWAYQPVDRFTWSAIQARGPPALF